MVVMASLFNVMAFATPDDSILSQHIKEADGTSGQNTNSGSGVKTDHIQNGAVTDAKISGTISTSKLNVGTVSGTVAAGNHNHDTDYQKKYANIVIVAKSGGDFTNPVSAVNSINNASASNPYLVKVMPGVYSLGGGSLQMKQYVDLEGSGPENTVITSSNNAGNECTVGTVMMANNMSIRNIKIVNTAPNLGGDYASAVAALVFNNVEAKAEGISVSTGSDAVAGGKNIGVCTYGASAHAILNNVYVESHNRDGQSSPLRYMGGKFTVTNSTLIATNGNADADIVNNDAGYIGNVTMVNVIMEATAPNVYGITSDGIYSVNISNSVIALHGSSTYVLAGMHTQNFFMENTKITCDGSCDYGVDPTKIKIANSLLPGNISALTGAKLINNYDENYDAIPNQ